MHTPISTQTRNHPEISQYDSAFDTSNSHKTGDLYSEPHTRSRSTHLDLPARRKGNDALTVPKAQVNTVVNHNHIANTAASSSHHSHAHIERAKTVNIPVFDAIKTATLLTETEQKLNSLGRPEGGWYFEQKIGPLHNLSSGQIHAIHDILESTSEVKNIFSFGARDGGFELAMQVRHDFNASMGIHKYPNHNLAHNYLDAISLQSNSETKITKLEDMDVFKMQNPFWDVGYKNGIEHARKMVFFVTQEWVASTFCQQEFQWLTETKNKNIKPSFVIFDDVNNNHEIVQKILDYAKEKNAYVINVANDHNPDLHKVSIKDSKELSFKRSLTADQLKNILDWAQD